MHGHDFVERAVVTRVLPARTMNIATSNNLRFMGSLAEEPLHDSVIPSVESRDLGGGKARSAGHPPAGSLCPPLGMTSASNLCRGSLSVASWPSFSCPLPTVVSSRSRPVATSSQPGRQLRG